MPSRKWSRPRQLKPPDGRIRQSHVVSTFGPGSMLDLIDDAVLVGGLDFWRLQGGGEVVNEPRLLEAVEPLFQRNKWPLSKEAPFRKPPAGDEHEPSEGCGIQVYEFPRWFVCQNPRCRALVRANSLERVNNEYRHRCSWVDARHERCVPVRFGAACRRGHRKPLGRASGGVAGHVQGSAATRHAGQCRGAARRQRTPARIRPERYQHAVPDERLGKTFRSEADRP